MLIFPLPSANPSELPTLNNNDWLSYHAVYRGNGYAMAVDQEGSLDLYFIKRRAKINRTWPIRLSVVLERRDKSKQAKWVKKKIKRSGFDVKNGAKWQKESVSFIASVTGDVRFQINYKFSKQSVTLTAKLIDPPSDADYRLSLVSDIGSLVTLKKSDSSRDLRKKTKGNQLLILSRNAKPLKIRFHEKSDLRLLNKNQPTSITLKAPKIGSKKLTWKLASPKLGTLHLSYKASNGLPHKGFTVSTIIVDEHGKTVGSGITLMLK